MSESDEDSKYDSMDFQLSFTDVTLLEANGEYEEVCRLMAKPQRVAGHIYASIPSSRWVLKSKITLQHAVGFAAVICDFYHDGRIVVTDYASSIKDVHSPDIRCLTAWALKYGWKVPEPKPSLADEWMEFWKRQWETYIVDSFYLEQKFGKRHPFIMGDETEIDDDDTDLEEEIKKL